MRPSFYVRIGKRLFDVGVSVVTLIVLLPVLAVVALLVRVFLGTPVLFRQDRPGRGGRTFTLVKFRTMTDERDAAGKLLPDDRRLTRFGRFLRSTSLDELPELLNILRGEMSLVGPRPLLIRYLPYYTPREQTRHDVLPGLTGWSQINGRVNRPWDERLELDAWYVENCSLALDLKILWRTVGKVLRRENVVHDAPQETLDLDDERRRKKLLTELPPITPAPAVAGRVEVLTTADFDAWAATLAQTARYDHYHLPSYHKLAESQNEGIARLFVYRAGDVTIALPLLLRPLNGEPWLSTADPESFDATSVYGYAGPVASRSDLPPEVLADFRHKLHAALRSQRIVSVFSRLHPLLEQVGLVEGLGECLKPGRTASLDLRRTDDELLGQMHRMHRKDIRLLREQGAEVIVDDSLEYLDRFVEIYHDNMRRVSATEGYFFPKEYFRDLLRDRNHARLLVVRLDGMIACGSVLLRCGDIVQYHLGATAEEFLTRSPIKLLFLGACTWGREQGCTVLHLGGGRGGKEDSLFQFKARFTTTLHDFHVWRWVIDADHYTRLCLERDRHDLQSHGTSVDTDFFPAYRRPLHLAEEAR